MAGPITPVQYILMDPSVPMTEGKARAQAAHAAVMGVYNSGGFEDRDVQRWMLGGHYAKVVLGCDDLFTTSMYLSDRGFKLATIIDEGRTEFESGLTLTAIGTTILNKNDPHVQATFGTFKLFKALPQSEIKPPSTSIGIGEGRGGSSRPSPMPPYIISDPNLTVTPSRAWWRRGRATP